MSTVARLNAALAGHYEIDREVGRGGMASVFLAQDVKHARRVAIKVLHPELAAAVGASRFLREIEIAAKLTHPHILSLHDSGERDGLALLRDAVRRGGIAARASNARATASAGGCLTHGQRCG